MAEDLKPEKGTSDIIEDFYVVKIERFINTRNRLQVRQVIGQEIVAEDSKGNPIDPTAKDVYGYVWEESLKREDAIVYQQSVSKLEIGKVIAAINGLEVK